MALLSQMTASKKPRGLRIPWYRFLFGRWLSIVSSSKFKISSLGICFCMPPACFSEASTSAASSTTTTATTPPAAAPTMMIIAITD